MVSCGEEDDPFLDLDQWTLDTTIPGHSCYVNGDSNLPVCAGTGDYDWEENFLAQLQQQESSDGDEEDEFLNEQAQPEEPSIKTFKGAILSLEEVQRFLEYRGHFDVSVTISTTVDHIASIHTNSVTQQTLFQYFSPS